MFKVQGLRFKGQDLNSKVLKEIKFVEKSLPWRACPTEASGGRGVALRSCCEGGVGFKFKDYSRPP